MAASGSFVRDSEAMGVLLHLFNASAGDRLKPGTVAITTYTGQKLPKLEDIPPGTVIIFDEAHSLKNASIGTGSGSKRGDWGVDAAEKAHAVMFCTATPADKIEHICYMERAGIFEGKTRDQQFNALGLEKKMYTRMVEVNGRKVQRHYCEWELRPDVTPEQMYDNIEALFTRMTARGLMLKREIAMDDVDVRFTGVRLSQECRDVLRRIQDHYYGYDDDGNESPPIGMRRAVMLGPMRRQQEPYKIPVVIDRIKQELAEGRQKVTSRWACVAVCLLVAGGRWGGLGAGAASPPPLWRGSASTGYPGLWWRMVPLYQETVVSRVWRAMAQELFVTSVFNLEAKPRQDAKLSRRLEECFALTYQRMSRYHYDIRRREQGVLELTREGVGVEKTVQTIIAENLYKLSATGGRTGHLGDYEKELLVEGAPRVVVRIRERLRDAGLIPRLKAGRPRKKKA